MGRKGSDEGMENLHLEASPPQSLETILPSWLSLSLWYPVFGKNFGHYLLGLSLGDKAGDRGAASGPNSLPLICKQHILECSRACLHFVGPPAALQRPGERHHC